MSEAEPHADRRGGPDRRRRPTPALSRYWLRGRRRGGRRDGERDRIYVDRPPRRALLQAVAILLLSVVDLLLTLAYLERGGEEANPVMAWALEGGVSRFAAMKLALTGGGALFLLLHVRFGRTRHALTLLLVLYTLLMAWHGWLWWHLLAHEAGAA